MTFKIKEGAETEGLPTVTLGGVPYFVARLPLGERIAVDQTMRALRPFLKEFQQKIAGAEGEIGTAAWRAKAIEKVRAGGVTVEIEEEHYRAMVKVVSLGLRLLYPEATPEALLREDIEFEELFAAWPVVVTQGASRRAAQGEAVATS